MSGLRFAPVDVAAKSSWAKGLHRLVWFLSAFAMMRAPAFADPPNVWTLNSIYVNSQLNGFAAVVSDQHDVSGGDVQIAVDGRTMQGYCPPGKEVMHFTWRFANSITRVTDGDTVTAALHADIAAIAPPCNGSIATLSTIALSQSRGITFPLPSDQRNFVDSDRFVPKTKGGANYAYAGQEPKSANASVGPDVGPAKPDSPWAYFWVQIGLRGSGEYWVVYVYKLGEDGKLGGGGTPSGNACGHNLGSGILAKWNQLGGEHGVLGCATSDEAEAGASPFGTTGRYALFAGSGGGLIVWHRDGTLSGATYEVHGCIGQLYQNMGGTGSWLGFPTSDEHDALGGRRSDFQGGFIYFDANTRLCTAHRNSGGVTIEPNVDRKGGDYTNFELDQADPELCRTACANDARCRAFTYVVPGTQGPKAHCWLKSSVPLPQGSGYCVSGVKN